MEKCNLILTQISKFKINSIEVNHNHETTTQKQKRKFFLPIRDLNPGPLETKVCFYLWNTGLETEFSKTVLKICDHPPPPQWIILNILSRNCP